MAALLRHGAARRVAGSVVQRTRPAFTKPAAREDRRLLTIERTRAVFTTPGPEELQRLLAMEHVGRRLPKSIQEALSRIHERKQELYDLISLMESTGHSNYKNRELLKYLSVQIQPRLEDSLWLRMRALKRMNDVARATVFVTGLSLCYHVWCSLGEGNMATQTAKTQEQ